MGLSGDMSSEFLAEDDGDDDVLACSRFDVFIETTQSRNFVSKLADEVAASGKVLNWTVR